MMLALLCAAPAAEAAFPGKNGKILFFRITPSQPVAHFLVNPDGTGSTNITQSQLAFDPEWSPDGSKYIAGDGYTLSVRDSAGNLLHYLSPETNGHNDIGVGAGWSPDGDRLAYSFQDWHCDEAGCNTTRQGIAMADPDGTAESVIFESGSLSTFSPSWSPDGTKLAFTGCCLNERRGVYTVNVDGTGLREISGLNSNSKPHWSPDGSKLVFEAWNNSAQVDELFTVHADGSGIQKLETGIPGSIVSPTWSPDGSKIAFQSWGTAPYDQGIYVVDAAGGTATLLIEDGQSPAWQPIPINGFPRPKAATPTYVPLVPAHESCGAPSRAHGGSLSYGSCAPTQQTSSHASVGTFDANGQPANSTGFVRLTVVSGDVNLAVGMTDVRSRSTLADYTGELRLQAQVRATDKQNTPHPGGPGPATIQDVTFGPPVPCATTSSTTTGSDCSLSTTVNALIPGLVVAGARSNWEFKQVRLYDGGADGDGDTQGDNTLFAVQGVFVP
jgi:TolB protein